MNQVTMAFLAFSGIALSLSSPGSGVAASQPAIRFGVVTDIHHTNKPDTETRKYSASLPKSSEFVTTMKENQAGFVIEMGDFVDTLAEGKDAAANLAELENEFTSFPGPCYHVLGNHEFDNVTRELFLKSVKNTGIPQGQTYYSWDASGIHFIVLDAGYTNEAPHRAFDMNTPADTFWTWKDAFIPEQEIQWLVQDLQKSKLPTIVFTHQTMDRVDDTDHNIKNASQVRKIFEDDGNVLVVFSGHDHQGGYSNIKGIHYVVMHGNVGVSDYRGWDATSTTNGYDTKEDNQFAMIEVSKTGNKNYTTRIVGYGHQPSYVLENTF